MPCNNTSCRNHGFNIVIDTNVIFAILKCIKDLWNQKGLPFSVTNTINFCAEKIENYFDALACCDIEGRLKVSNLSLLEEIDPSNDNSSFNRISELRDFFGQSTDLKNVIRSKLFSYLRSIEVTTGEISELKNQILGRRILYARDFSRSRVDLSLVVSALKLGTDVIFLCEEYKLNNTIIVLKSTPHVIINGISYQTEKVINQSVFNFLREPFKCCEIELKDYLLFVFEWGIQCTQGLGQSSDSFPRHVADIGFITTSFERDRREKYQSQL